MIIDAREVFVDTREKVYYCVEFNGKDILGKVISIFDLDNDGILRIAFPTDPYHGNNYFTNYEGVERINLNAFETVDEALSYSDQVLKITMDTNTFRLKKNPEVITKSVKIAK